MQTWLCIHGDVYRQKMLGTILRSCYAILAGFYFVAEAARLGEARTEARTYQQLTCSGQTGTAVALVSERSVIA